jgi:outer membrane protein TolC
MEAERDLRNVQLEYEQTRAAYARARAELDRTLGLVPGLSGEGDQP